MSLSPMDRLDAIKVALEFAHEFAKEGNGSIPKVVILGWLDRAEPKFEQEEINNLIELISKVATTMVSIEES